MILQLVVVELEAQLGVLEVRLAGAEYHELVVDVALAWR